MNRPDCGNQRTGQPRCAQLTAKTWNCSPSTRRTQQAVSAVLPSVGITIRIAERRQPRLAFREFADAAERHPRRGSRSPRPRVTDERRKRTIGTASAAATDAVEQNSQLHEAARGGTASVSFDIVS